MQNNNHRSEEKVKNDAEVVGRSVEPVVQNPNPITTNELAQAIMVKIVGWQNRMSGIEMGYRNCREYKRVSQYKEILRGMELARVQVIWALQECGVTVPTIEPIYKVEDAFSS